MARLLEEQVLDILRMFACERVTVDDPQPGRTCFLSHLGAQPKLLPGAWIAHRDLIYALALANLTPLQRSSLARALIVEYEREFGIGRLRLWALPSDVPRGGSSLVLEPRTGDFRCLYTWALGPKAKSTSCDWLLLRAQPEWALDAPPPPLRATGLETLAALGGDVLVLASSASDAIAIASQCSNRVQIAAHPRFAPHFEGTVPDAPVLLWPTDALDRALLRRPNLVAVALVGAAEPIVRQTRAWLEQAAAEGRDIELVEIACPGRMDRAELSQFWSACGRPKILLQGDPAWAGGGARWLRDCGARVHVQGEGTQLSLL